MKTCPSCKGNNENDAKFCEHCGHNLAVSSKTESKSVKNILIGVGAVLLLLLSVFLVIKFFKKEDNPNKQEDIAGNAPNVILKLAGSNTIGAKLAPELAKSFLENKLGVKDVKIIKLDKDGLEQKIIGLKDKDSVSILISSHGSKTAFENLKKGTADIGMSSRQINDNEVDNSISTSRQSEHVIGMDGIAVIVNETNSISEISLNEVAQLFGGAITNWSAIQNRNSNLVNVYARDEKSGTWEFFEKNVLKKYNQNLIGSAKRFESTHELSAHVASNVNAVGFVSASEIGNAKALKIYEQNTIPLLPTTFTISTEDYLISRRLYFYTSTNNTANKNISDFIDFCLSNQGQEKVKEAGFISLIITTECNVKVPGDASSEYRNIIQNAGSCRLSVNIRFKTGSNDMDNKAFRDMNRIIDFLSRPENQNKRVVLCGFSDNVGSFEKNKELSEKRAASVQSELKSRGINAEIHGFGPIAPVSDNSSDAGKEKNRRVELWIL